MPSEQLKKQNGRHDKKSFYIIGLDEESDAVS